MLVSSVYGVCAGKKKKMLCCVSFSFSFLRFYFSCSFFLILQFIELDFPFSSFLLIWVKIAYICIRWHVVIVSSIFLSIFARVRMLTIMRWKGYPVTFCYSLLVGLDKASGNYASLNTFFFSPFSPLFSHFPFHRNLSFSFSASFFFSSSYQ